MATISTILQQQLSTTTKSIKMCLLWLRAWLINSSEYLSKISKNMRSPYVYTYIRILLICSSFNSVTTAQIVRDKNLRYECIKFVQSSIPGRRVVYVKKAKEKVWRHILPSSLCFNTISLTGSSVHIAILTDQIHYHYSKNRI